MKEETSVFKVGTSSLTQENGSLDRIKVARLTNQLAQLHQEGYHLVLVTSGAIARSSNFSTIAGLVALEENNFRFAVIDAVNQALAKTKELGK